MCVVYRLLAENHVCSAVVQALKHAVEAPQQTLPSRLPDDFSIAAIQLHTSNTPIGNGQIGKPLDRDLISALLRAAVAFSTSQQLSEQLLASGVMLPLALLLNQGSVRDRHTPLVVELLWNLLEACPLSDAHTEDHLAAGNSTLRARHSQIIKPRQKMLNDTNLSGVEQDGDCDSVAEHELTFTRDDTAATDQPEDDAKAGMDFWDALEEEFPQEPQQASVECPADRSSSCAADTEVAAGTPGTTCDAATEADAEAAAHSGHEGSSSSFPDGASSTVKSRLSGQGNRQASANSDTSTSPPSAADDGKSAVGDRSAEDDTGSDESSSQAAAATGLTDDTAGVGVEEEVAAGIIRLLTDCFERGYSTADKELRNTVLVVSGMLAESAQYRRALCCPEMLQQLVIASTEPALGDCSTTCFKVPWEQLHPVHKRCCAVLPCAVLCCAMLSFAELHPCFTSACVRAQHSVYSLSTHVREIGCMHYKRALQTSL